MARTYDAVVLMGTSGSGKSHLGRLLKARGVCAYRELEPVLIARFGAREAFVANKDAALAFIERSYRAQIARAAVPVAIESTGHSDAPILTALARRRRLLWVAVDTPAALCAERVTRRAGGRNLTNDPDEILRLHAFWNAQIAPRWRFDLRVDGADAEGAVARIAKALNS